MNAPIKSISKDYLLLHPIVRFIWITLALVLAGIAVGVLMNATAAVAVGSVIMVVGSGLYCIQWYKEEQNNG